MTSNTIRYSESRDLPLESVLVLYRANEWSSAHKPDLLHKALLASHSLVTAWDGSKLVGLTTGALVDRSISGGVLLIFTEGGTAFQATITGTTMSGVGSENYPVFTGMFTGPISLQKQ